MLNDGFLQKNDVFRQISGNNSCGGETMEHEFPEYLCLTDLLDQDLSAYEYFQTLPPELQTKLRREDQISSFAELQKRGNDV